MIREIRGPVNHKYRNSLDLWELEQVKYLQKNGVNFT